MDTKRKDKAYALKTCSWISAYWAETGPILVKQGLPYIITNKGLVPTNNPFAGETVLRYCTILSTNN